MEGDPLPPTGEAGDATFTVSIGWCGGHGEAVLDGEQRIRHRDDLPIYVDAKSWERIEPRLDLSGTWQGAPVARVRARVRLKPRSAWNRTIFPPRRQKYMALEILDLAEVQVVGEREPTDS